MLKIPTKWINFKIGKSHSNGGLIRDDLLAEAEIIPIVVMDADYHVHLLVFQQSIAYHWKCLYLKKRRGIIFVIIIPCNGIECRINTTI
jgi:hypothetical protein